MGEMVTIPVTYRGEEREFEAEMQVWQYGHRFLVSVDAVLLVFERDDSGDYRALMPEGQTGKPPDRGLVQAIAEVLGSL
jgi:hypothetical protein